MYTNHSFRTPSARVRLMAATAFIWISGWADINAQTLLSDSQVTIRQVTWSGNQVFDSKTLAQHLGIRPAKQYRKKALPSELAETDLRKTSTADQGIRSIYRNRGHWFFSQQILQVAAGENQVDIHIRIFEGPQMRVGQLVVEGTPAFTPAEIEKLTGIRTGEVFNEAQITASGRPLVKSGKIKGNMQIIPRLNAASNAIDIVYSFP